MMKNLMNLLCRPKVPAVLVATIFAVILTSCTIIRPDGSSTTFLTDGSRVERSANGYTVQYFQDGSRKILSKRKVKSSTSSVARNNSKPKAVAKSKASTTPRNSAPQKTTADQDEITTFIPKTGDHTGHDEIKIKPHVEGEIKDHTSGEHKHD